VRQGAGQWRAGDRTNPVPGGTGLLFIDDIGIGKPIAAE